jgi:hypothetical protein
VKDLQAPMTPVLIGYFPRRRRSRAEDARAQALPPQIEEFCNVGHMRDGTPQDWVELWLHNALWLYSTEAQAWGAAVDTANLRRIFTEESRRWDGVRGSVQRIMHQHIACHVPSPKASCSPTDPRFNWQLHAYRMFPIRFANGAEESYEVEPGDLEPVQPLPGDYVSLGLDVVSRHCENMFECSPLNCNGHYDTVTVNRYCLLDQFENAVQLARYWSGGKYNAELAFVGPAEPGPYFIIEVLRKRLEAS